MKKTLVGMLVILGCIKAWSATVTATSCSLEDVQAAIAAAASGDTVQVPAGKAAWPACLEIDRAITLRGAGVGKTVIENGGPVSRSDFTLLYQPQIALADAPFRVTGFTLDGKLSGGGVVIANTSTTKVLSRVLIDRNEFANCWRAGHPDAQPAIRLDGLISALVTQNRFTDNEYAVRVFGKDNFSWLMPVALGSPDSNYIEGNQFFGNRVVLSSGWGARWVFRFNYVDLANSDYNVLDAHGNMTAPGPGATRGCVAVEIYNNVFTNAARPSLRLVDIRGGTAMVYSNRLYGTVLGGNASITIREEDDDGSFMLKFDWPGYDPITNSYLWDNLNNGLPITFENADPVVFLHEGRDYWLTPPPATFYKALRHPHPLAPGVGRPGPLGDLTTSP